MQKSLQTYLAWLWVMILLWASGAAYAQSFTQGNLVVLRVGDGSASLSSAATPVSLVEYSPSGGSPVSTLAMPTTVSGSNARLTQSGTAGSEGGLTLSADKRYLTLVGYDAAVGTASVAGTSSTTTNRVVARVDKAKNINSSTRLTAYSANNIRSAVSNDGTQFWTAGPSTGIAYTTLGSTGSFTTISGFNSRIITITNGQLYISSASGMNQSVSRVGTGLPTTSGQTVTALPGLPTVATASGVFAYAFFDRDQTVPGVDLLYVADQSNTSAGGILKYSFDGTTWTARGSVTGVATGLTGAVNGTGIDLYVTVGTSAGNAIYKLTDAAAYSATIMGSGTAITAAGTLLATAPTNTAFRGIAFAPGADEIVTTPTLTVNPTSLPLGTTIQGTPSTPLTYTLTAANLTDAIGINAPVGVEISTAPTGSYGSTFQLPASTTTATIYARLTGASAAVVSGNITNISSASVSGSVVVSGTVTAGASPTIGVGGTTTAYLTASAVSGVVNNASDPASTYGIDFTLADPDTDVNSLVVTASSSNGAVVPNGNLNLTGSGASRNLKITPTGVGYATITVIVSDGNNTASYVINYAASAASTSTSRFHTGRSDASTAIDAGGGYMLVGDDENNAIRLYNRNQSGLPVNSFDYTSSLGLTQLSNGVPREVDIEASAKSGNRIFWFGSQSNNDEGTARPNRDRVFGTDVTGTGASTTLSYAGRYDFLREDLIAWDVNNGHGKGANYYGLAANAAAGVGSKQPDGYNIEGAEFAPNNSTLYIGFRAPQVPTTSRTKALVVPVTNLASLLAANGGGTQGSATFGAPIEMDLGGRGIREIRRNAANQYLIVAGAAGEFGAAPNDFRLYTWSGNPADAPVLRAGDLSQLAGTGSSVESIVGVPASLDETSSIQFLMDNGDLNYYNNGTVAKDLTENNFKKFRSDYAIVGAAIGVPTLATSPTTLTSFTANQGTASASQTYVLMATNLPASLTVTAPTGVAVSSDNSTFTSSLVLPQSTTATTVYARLTAEATGAVSGTITNSSGTLSANVTVNGTVNAAVTPPFTGTLATWTFEGDVNTPATVVANTTAGNATFGAGVTSVTYVAGVGGAPGRAYTAAGWSASTSVVTADNDYLEFTIAPGANYKLDLATVTVSLQRSGTGPQNVVLRSSVDDFANNIGNVTNPGNGSFASASFPLDGLTSRTTPTIFRLYGYASTGTGGTLRFDNLTVTGTVSSAGPPVATLSATPSSLTGNNGLSYVEGNGPASKTLSVSGSNLSTASGAITVSSASLNFTVSPATLPFSNSTLAATNITVQLAAGLSVGNYSTTVTLSGGGTTLTIPVSGTVNSAQVTTTLISQIQGSGSTFNPTYGGTRTIEGVVTRTFPGSTKLNGFYVQEEDSDSDNNPATSEGIFVYDPAGLFTGIEATKVRVTGTVAEFTSSSGGITSSLTQLGTLTSVVNLGTVPLPSVSTLTLPVANVAELERYEGMLVNVRAATGNLAVTEYFQLGRYGQVVLSATGATDVAGTDARLDQYTQFNAPSVSGYAAYLAEIAKRKIILDDGSTVQNPDPILFGRGGQPLSAANTLRGGDEVASVTAVLDQRLEGYRLQTLTGVDFIAANARPATPPAVGGTLKVGSLNLLNYFNGNGTGGGFPTSRGASTLTEFNRQRAKTIRAIVEAGVDVFAFNELENDGYGSTSAIQDIINGVNEATAPGTFTFVNPGTTISTDEITVAMIYKPAKVTPVGPAATLSTSAAFTTVGRFPLAQTFSDKATGAVFTVVANHWKSKGSSSGGVGDADSGDGQGASNGTRTRQAQDLISWLATKPTGTNDPDYLILGDLNSYAMEDPVKTLEQGGYANLVPNTTYSYVFDGFVGALDHALGSASLASQVTQASKWHINADEPSVLDYNTEFKTAGQVNSLYNADQFRVSDHDPVIVGLALTSPVTALTISASASPVTLTTSGSTTLTVNASGGTAPYSYSFTGPGVITPSGNTASVSGLLTGVQTFTVLVTDAGLPTPQTISATASVTVTAPLAASLQVLYRDADYGNTDNAIIKPFLQLSNTGEEAIPYQELTLRYWLTPEGNAPPTNLAVYYAPLGTVSMRYVPLDQPRQGALGYIEYSFPTSGSLTGGSNSGPIENGIQKTDGSNFNESDDYSYAANYQTYVPNARVTAYRNGTIIWGQEPAMVTSQTAVTVYSAAKDGTTTSQIQTRLELRNTGNVALPVGSLKLRYYFTSDNNQPANVYVDYADIGADKVAARVIKLPAAVDGADSYVELSFPNSTMQVNALSSLGVIDFRLVRSDYGLFTQSNDYSYAANYGNVGLNAKVTVYLDNRLIFGTPPTGGPARLGAPEPVAVLRVQVLGNPVVGDQAQLLITGVAGQAVSLRLVDLQGRAVHEQRIEQAAATESVCVPLGHNQGQLLLKVSTDSQQQSIKLLRP